MTTSAEASLRDQFASVRFPRPFRRCQELALDAFEKSLSQGHDRFHLVLPPGTGKTVLGLEIARRLGRRTLVLCPNTAIQAQWALQWAEFQPRVIACGTEPEELGDITALTYQAVCVLEDDEDLAVQSISLWRDSLQQNGGLTQEEAEEEIEQLREAGGPHYGTELARFKQRARMLATREGSREELLWLLHPNGRELLERMKASGPWTIVLDECHHLLEMWGYLVRAVLEELGSGTQVVGLTATPPRDLDHAQKELYRDLFTQTDFELPSPAAVRDGSLAPYQDLVYLTTPIPHELDYIDEQHARFLKLISRLVDQDFGSIPFVQWAQERALGAASSRKKVVHDWGQFEKNRPALGLALLRFLNHYRLELPEGVHLQERHRQQLTADDWVTLLEEYCLRQLRPSSDERDHAAWQEVRAALPSVGYVLTSRGIRSYVSPVDRVLSLSASKGSAALAILGAEEQVLKEQLRAVILCDYEQAGSELLARLRGVLDPQAGSAALLMKILLTDPQAAQLNPMLMTGRTVACSRATAYDLECWLAGRRPHLEGSLETRQLTSDGPAGSGWEELVVLKAQASWWRPRNYVPEITRYFEEGRSRCLVGTRGLLGEGWDARRVNVLIDLTAATTSTAVHQSRGRSLRLDPALPEKVADNWDVVCVSPRHPRGFADYARFVRKHRHYYGLTADGDVESGVSHVDNALSPYGAPSEEQFGAINQRQIGRISERKSVAEKWAVGKPYENRETQTLRVRVGKPSSLPATKTARAKRSKQTIDDLGRDWTTIWAGGGLLASIFLVPLALNIALWVGISGAALAALPPAASLAPLLGRAATSPLVRKDATAGVRRVAAAIAEALFKIGAVSIRPGKLRVVPQQDGYLRCYLEGGTTEESTIFADALDEALSPLGNPRGIVPRYVLQDAGRLRRVRSSIVLHWRPSASSAGIMWHAVPGIFTTSKERAMAFQRAWNRHVSPGKILYSHGYLAQEIIQAQRGENPMEINTQARMLWR